MSEFGLITDELKTLERSYRPSEEVAKKLAGVILVPVIGPTGIGKSTTIDYVLEHFPGFHRSHSSTSRDIRPGESPDQYDFRPHDETTLQEVLTKVRNQALVQYAVHPTTGRVYWSEIDTYDPPYTMIDAMGSAVEALQQIPFKDIAPVSLACRPEAWEIRSPLRAAAPEEFKRRVGEAVIGLEWSLDQPDMAWVDSSSRSVGTVAGEIVGVVTGQQQPDPANRRVGEELLAYMKQLS